MSNPDPQYNLTANMNTNGSLVADCTWCGAAVVNTELHTQWHHGLAKEISRALVDAARRNGVR